MDPIIVEAVNEVKECAKQAKQAAFMLDQAENAFAADIALKRAKAFEIAGRAALHALHALLNITPCASQVIFEDPLLKGLGKGAVLLKKDN